MKTALHLSISALAFAIALVLAGSACGPHDLCGGDRPNTICTIAGNGEQGYGDDGPALATPLYIPQDTAIAPNGDLWILDFNNYQVRSLDVLGNLHTEVGSGLLGDSPAPGELETPARTAMFNHTTDLFFHDGYLYLAAWHNSRVKRVKLETMMLENYAGIGKRTIYTGDGGPAISAALDLPSSIALDPRDDSIVVMDQANQVIRKIDGEGVITRIAGTCVVDGDSPCNGAGPSACPAPSNKLACGNLDTECSKPCTPGYGGDGGDALDARISQPFGQKADPAGRLVYDGQGNLIFADTGNHRLRKVDVEGKITTIAGTGEAGYSGDGGPAGEAMINHPVDVAAAEDGTIYFTDVFNNCVRKIDPAGIISTAVGRCSSDPDERGFTGDGGAPEEARLNRPYGIELAGDKLYVADSYNNRVRVVHLP